MKQVRYTQGRMAERSKAPDSRNSPLRLLVHECVRGFESTPVKFCVQKGNILIEAVSNPTPVELYVQKANILVEAVVLRVKWEARQTDFALQEGVIEDRMKQVRYTQGRMAERSKAPDSRNSPSRLLVHECVRGSDSHCQILRSKRQHFNRSSIESHSCQILRSKSQHFRPSSISDSQIKSKTEQISHYKKVLSKTEWSKCDIIKAGWPSGLRRQTQEILLLGFWYTNVCVGTNPTPVKFCVQKANISVEAGVLRVKREARQTDFTLQEGVIEDRMKQVRFTQGKMAERSKASDSRNSPSRLLVHECVRGIESHSCQILRSKWQHFIPSSIESHSCQILRSKSQHFGRSSISDSQIKSKTEQISHYKEVLSKTGWSKCDIIKAGWPSGLRRQTQEILL